MSDSVRYFVLCPGDTYTDSWRVVGSAGERQPAGLNGALGGLVTQHVACFVSLSCNAGVSVGMWEQPADGLELDGRRLEPGQHTDVYVDGRWVAHIYPDGRHVGNLPFDPAQAPRLPRLARFSYLSHPAPSVGVGGGCR